jgi:uncharacterized membrane protein
MGPVVQTIADKVALGCELLSVLLLAVGAIEAVVALTLSARHWADIRPRRAARVRFAAWIMLALELTLASDIVRTAISPTWNDIGQLAAIALIRTILGLFLERDTENLERDHKPAANGRTAAEVT